MKLGHFTAPLGTLLVLAGCGGSEVSGTITGLTAAGLTLTNGYETISVAKDATSFSFPTDVEENNGYAVVVVTQPTGLLCSVSNGSGTASGALSASSVSIGCVAVWPISGPLSGLSRSGLVLNNGYEDISVAAGAASFAFPTPLAAGSSYSVIVQVQPTVQVCTVDGGEGQIDNAPVANVAVTCR